MDQYSRGWWRINVEEELPLRPEGLWRMIKGFIRGDPVYVDGELGTNIDFLSDPSVYCIKQKLWVTKLSTNIWTSLAFHEKPVWDGEAWQGKGFSSVDVRAISLLANLQINELVTCLYSATHTGVSLFLDETSRRHP